MKCTFLRKKGWIQIAQIHLDKEKKRLECIGIYPKNQIYWCGFCVFDYQLIEVNDRLMALPIHLCEGIEI